jgi:hypothetical protein
MMLVVYLAALNFDAWRSKPWLRAYNMLGQLGFYHHMIVLPR